MPVDQAPEQIIVGVDMKETRGKMLVMILITVIYA